MADHNTPAGPGVKAHPSTFSPVAAFDYPVGTPVAIDDDGGLAGPANAANEPTCVGLARTRGVTGERTITQYGDVLQLTAAEWNTVGTGAGGLLDGLAYYLSETPGQITATPPVTAQSWVVPLGIAVSNTELLILLGIGTLVPIG
jgi:hypothetical protein